MLFVKIIATAQTRYFYKISQKQKTFFAQNNRKSTKRYLHTSNHKNRKCSLTMIITKAEHNEHAVCNIKIVKSQNIVFVQIPRNVLIIIFAKIPTKV
jgi:hypothetical protein